MTERAFSVIAVKALDDEQREFSGLATSPAPDRVDDIVEPLGIKFTNPLPLLRAHDHQSPIGTVRFGRPTKSGIGFTARIPRVDEPGLLKDRVDMAWQEIKHGLVRAVSIGFRPLEAEPLPNGGTRFLKSEVFELSTVVVPAQSLAVIDQVRAIDAAVRRGEAPAPQRSLWERIGRIGLDSLNEANAELKHLGDYGLTVASARSTQAMLKAICEHIEERT